MNYEQRDLVLISLLKLAPPPLTSGL